MERMNSTNISQSVVTTACSFSNGGYGSLRVNNVITHSKPWINGRDRQAVAAVLESGMLTQGQLTHRFENAVARFLGTAGAVAAGSGTAALALALKALELGSDAEVILPTYVCRNVLDAVLVAGYTPALCDMGRDWHMTAETVAPAVTRRARAVMAVHPFGIAVTLNLEQTGLAVVEDACQAFGARHPDGRAVGTVGRAGVVSFHVGDRGQTV